MGTKIGYGIAILAGVATILGWLERSQWVRAFPGWIHQIVSQPWFLSTAFALTLLALVGTGLWKLRALEKRQESGTGEAIGRVNSLESRVLQQLNKSLRQLRAPIDDRLFQLERRVTKLEPGLAGIALQVQDLRGERYKVVSDDGGVREWTRGEIDDLPEPQKAKLFARYPDLSDWWLGKPKS